MMSSIFSILMSGYVSVVSPPPCVPFSPVAVFMLGKCVLHFALFFQIVLVFRLQRAGVGALFFWKRRGFGALGGRSTGSVFEGADFQRSREGLLLGIGGGVGDEFGRLSSGIV